MAIFRRIKDFLMAKLPRNAPCWCGSGKKYKQCHLRSDQEYARAYDMLARSNVIIKTAEQIDGIRRASELTRDILDELETRIQPGITTQQIDEWVYAMTLEAGAIPAPLNYRGFPKSCCTSLNEVICHGIPEDRTLIEGDILNVDVTSILNGFYGDSSRMFLIGEVSAEARELVEVTRECLYLGIEQVKPGNHIGDIGHAIQTHAEAHGFSVVRQFVGHGTGVEFHEPPNVQHYGNPGGGLPLVPNMTFTIEPMINVGEYEGVTLDDDWTTITVDGSLSAQWEHTLLVTDNGVEALTAKQGEFG